MPDRGVRNLGPGRGGVPVYAFPEATARVLGKLAAYAEWRSQPAAPVPVRVVAGALEVAVVAGGRSAGALEGLAEALREAEDVRAEGPVMLHVLGHPPQARQRGGRLRLRSLR